MSDADSAASFQTHDRCIAVFVVSVVLFVVAVYRFVFLFYPLRSFRSSSCSVCCRLAYSCWSPRVVVVFVVVVVAVVVFPVVLYRVHGCFGVVVVV